MKLKSFQDLLEDQFTKEEIVEIKRQAKAEVDALRKMQNEVKRAVDAYMKKHKVGFNEMMRRLGTSPSQFSKIQKGEANLTMASIAHLSALLDSPSTLQFKKR